MALRSSAHFARRAAMVGLGLLLAFAALFVCGCAPADDSKQSSSQSSNAPLRVAIQTNALSIPTVYAYDNGYFSDLGLDVELSTFVNGAEENKALERGDVDLASDGLASVYMLANGNFTWIGESDDASSTVGIYVKEGSAPTTVSGQIEDQPDVKGSADTLRGLTVVGPAGTMEEWAAVSYFSQFDLTPDVDFDFVEMDREQAVQAMIDGNADVFVASDVDYCRIMEENGFVPVAVGSQATGVPFNNGYVVSNEVLETRYEDLVLFLKAVYQASETLNNDPDLWNDFALEFYRANGKPATMEDVKRESQVRTVLLPSDFQSEDYALGSGVLGVGLFHAQIGALGAEQVSTIEKSINPQVLEDALGISVPAATL